MASERNDTAQGLTLAIVGCGNLGIAILSGILSSISAQETSSSSDESSGKSRDGPDQIPTKFIACVSRPASIRRVEDELAKFRQDIKVTQGANVDAVQHADVVILGCKPYHLTTVLQEEGMREALQGKLLISILAGVPVTQIQDALYASKAQAQYANACRIVRVMPNTAAMVRQSMTVIASSEPPLPSNWETLVNWIFQKVGQVVTLPASQMDACTALCGSGPAIFALVLEAMADGAVAMGLPRAEAQMMAAQTMRGTSELVQNGEHPARLREKVSSPGGCTIGGLLVLEEGAVRGTVAKSVREAATIASLLGKGIKGVNGTRH